MISKREDGRGHKPSLSDEKTVKYNIKMPKSLKEKAMRVGPIKVRKAIKKIPEKGERE